MLARAPEALIEALAASARLVRVAKGADIRDLSSPEERRDPPSRRSSPTFGFAWGPCTPTGTPFRLPDVFQLDAEAVWDLCWETPAGDIGRSTLYQGDFLGVEEHLSWPSGPPWQQRTPWITGAKARTDGLAWTWTDAEWTAIGASVGASLFEGIERSLAHGTWAATNPALDEGLAMRRVALAALAEPLSVPAGTVLFEANERPPGVYLVLGRGAVEVTRNPGTSAQAVYTLRFGDLVGERCLVGGSAAPSRAVVTVDADLLLLRRELLDAIRYNPLAPLHRDVARLRQRFVALERPAEAAATALAGELGVPRNEVFPLLQGATPAAWAGGAPPPTPLSAYEGLTYLEAGEVLSYHVGTGISRPVYEVRSVHSKREVLGLGPRALYLPVRRAWRARLPSQTVFVPRTQVVGRLGVDPWATLPPMPPPPAVGLPLTLVDRSDGQAWTAACDALVALTVAEVADTYGEHVLGVRITAGPVNAATLKTTYGAPVHWCDATAKNTVADVLASIALARAAAAVDTSFVPTRIVAVWVDGPAGTPSTEELSWHVHRLFRVHLDLGADLVDRPMGAHLVHAWLLPSAIGLVAGVRYPPSTTRARVDLPTLTTLVLGIGGDPYAKSADLLAAVRALPDSDDRLEGGMGYHVGALGRAITHRRVGLALSGGEAWGFAHYALLLALAKQGIPLDLVAGVSAGAVVGAHWCVGGETLLHRLMERRWQVLAVGTASFLTSTLFERYLDHEFGGRLLEDLDLPLVPVATNADRYSPEPVLTGPVALGCRKSGSFVPLYPPTPTDHGTYIDGAFSENLPTETLLTEGMRLVVSSNAMGAPTVFAPWPPLFDGKVGRVLADLNPVRRMHGLREGVFSLAHLVGGTAGEMGDASFQFERPDTWVFDMRSTPTVVAEALSQPGLWALVDQVTALWQRVKTHP